MKVALAQMNPTIGDIQGNGEKILAAIEKAKRAKADLILFPEMTISGYPPEDLVLFPTFIEAVEKKLSEIVPQTKGIAVVLGLPRRNSISSEKPLLNSAAIIQDGSLIGFHDKNLLPTYDVFDERRYFEPGSQTKIWSIAGKKVAVTICEDIWQHSQILSFASYPKDPVLELAKHHPDLVLNLSSSPFHSLKPSLRQQVCVKAAKTLQAPLLLCNQVGGNDSLIFDGYSLCVGKKGQLIGYAKGFEEDLLFINPFAEKEISFSTDWIGDIYQALILGIRDYFQKQGFKKACLGLSGGIDSALVACLAVEALGKENVLALAMPSRFSSKESLEDAQALADTLGIQLLNVPIEEPFTSYLQLLEPYFEGKPFDTTEENLQARIRGMILMAFSNKYGYIVLSTGNKSEMAMGYSTLYGDMCGGVGVINDVSKMQVYALSEWINKRKLTIPQRTIDRPPSAELRPNQKDSDSLPDYSVVDNVLVEYVENHRSPEEIAEKYKYPLPLVEDLVRRIHRNEYKRRQAPPGLRISEKAFSIGRRFPIVQGWN